ncbi:MAG: hypothetical protein ACREKN_06270 [Longimicrobiaceae bacterium]
MANYERSTVFTAREVFECADRILAERAGVARLKETRHQVTYRGDEGTVTVRCHRHGPSNTVTAVTDRLRTSKLDNAVRHLMNRLPYQPGDLAGGRKPDPPPLSRTEPGGAP